MHKKYFFHILIIIIIFAVENSFLSGLPLYLNRLNLMLIALVFVLGLVNLTAAVLWSIGFGILLDIYSFSFFGINVVSLILTVLLVNFFLVKFFTDRSLYTFLALTGLATVICELLSSALGHIGGILSGKEIIATWNGDFFKAEFFQISFNLAAAFLIFYSVHYISKRLRPVFLLKKK